VTAPPLGRPPPKKKQSSPGLCVKRGTWLGPVQGKETGFVTKKGKGQEKEEKKKNAKQGGRGRRVAGKRKAWSPLSKSHASRQTRIGLYRHPVDRGPHFVRFLVGRSTTQDSRNKPCVLGISYSQGPSDATAKHSMIPQTRQNESRQETSGNEAGKVIQ
jgi:hypothetical protein